MPTQIGAAAGSGGAVLLSILPGLVALDSGGAFAWTYWLTAVVAFLAVLMACVTYVADRPASGVQPHLLTFGLLLLCGYACFQTLSMPTSLVGLLSSGSAAAWTDWMPDAVPEGVRLGDASAAPISVQPTATTYYAALLILLAALSWSAAVVFSTRERLLLLLTSLAVSGVIHSAIGFWQLLDSPQSTVWGLDGSSPFGVFLNRNNAALFLGLTLAACMGLIGWRLTSVTGHHFGDGEFSPGLLLDLTTDRLAMFAGLATAINWAGLLACGSRGGMIGALVGIALSVGFMRSGKIARQAIAFLVVGCAVAGLLLIRFDVSPKSLERFGASAKGAAESIYEDGRLEHWADGLDAMWNYAPAGAGLGTYRYAHLPYQTYGAEGWYYHADNLWLELLVEGGLLALLLFAGLAVALAYALVQLRDTADPLDQGIATAGWMLLGVVGCSQTFDFGLLLGGSAITVTVLTSTVLGRAAIQGVPLWKFGKSRDGGRLQFVSKASLPYGLAFGGVLLLGLLFATPRLAREATVEGVVRTVDVRRPQKLEEVNMFREQLGDLVNAYPTATLLTEQMARLDLLAAQRGAYEELAGSQLWNERVRISESRILLWMRQVTNLLSAEGVWDARERAAAKQTLAAAYAKAEPDLQRAREEITRTLGACPLAPEPRTLLATVNLLESDRPATAGLLEQVLKLRRSSTVSLLALADVAAVQQDWELASEAWRRAIRNDLTRLDGILDKAETLGHPDSLSLVPRSAAGYRLASLRELEKEAPNRAFLQEAVTLLQEEMPAERPARARRFLLVGRLYAALGQVDQQLAMYERASQTDRNNMEVNLSYLYALLDNNRIAAASTFLEALEERAPVSDPRLELANRKLVEKREQLKNQSNPRRIISE